MKKKKKKEKNCSITFATNGRITSQSPRTMNARSRSRFSSNSLLARFLPNRFHLDVNIFSPISENKSLHVK